MFERFTDRARRVIVLAQSEARSLHHNYIGTEHLLLGLVKESDGVAAKALSLHGVNPEGVRQQIVAMIGEGTASEDGHIPFTPHARQVLELSLREALQLGHNYIGTEHILLGLIREGEGVGPQVLAKMDIDLSELWLAVLPRRHSRLAPLYSTSLAVTSLHWQQKASLTLWWAVARKFCA